MFKYTREHSFDDIAKYSLNLLGTPYSWGGKSGFGYDCSGLIQSLLFFKNINFPRDTKDQICSNYLCYSKLNIPKRGDLIYFFENIPRYFIFYLFTSSLSYILYNFY